MRTKKTRLRKQSGFRRLCLEHKQMQQELRELSMNDLVNATSTTQITMVFEPTIAQVTQPTTDYAALRQIILSNITHDWCGNSELINACYKFGLTWCPCTIADLIAERVIEKRMVLFGAPSRAECPDGYVEMVYLGNSIPTQYAGFYEQYRLVGGAV